MKRRSFLGLLAAVVGLQLKPDLPVIGIDWASGPDRSVWIWQRANPNFHQVTGYLEHYHVRFVSHEVVRAFCVPASLLERDVTL